MSDIPGSAKTKATLPRGTTPTTGTFDRAGDSDWYRISVKAGQDYALGGAVLGEGEGFDLVLRNGKGKALDSALIYPSEDGGLSFRAKASGTYFVEVQGDEADYSLLFTADARQDDTTQDTITDGHDVGRFFTYAADEDWYRLRLHGGVTYHIETSGSPDLVLMSMDKTGEVLATGTESLTFTPDRDATYFLSAANANDGAGAYTIGLWAS